MVTHNTKSNAKDGLLTTIIGSSQQILMKTSSSNSGYMIARQPPTKDERPTNRHITERAGKKPLTRGTSKDQDLLEGVMKRRTLKQHSLWEESHQPSYMLTLTV